MRLLAAAVAALTGCTAVLGVNDVFFDPSTPQGGADGSVVGADGAVLRPDGGARGDAACEADLEKDPRHCGRCNHDCVGGACTGGKCEPVLLASVSRPAGVAVDETYVYATSYAEGSITRVDKRTGQGAKVLTTVPTAHGILLTQTPRRLWFTSDVNNSVGGGLFACTPPECTDTTPIGALGNGRHLAAEGNTVFVATSTGVFKVTSAVAVTAPVLVNDQVGQPFAVAADAAHVYYTSLAVGMRRTQVDGGGGAEVVGPFNSPTNFAFVTLDANRFYWAYTDATTKKGQVVGADKAAVATRTTYTSTGERSAGVAVDATYLYWVDDGTSTNDVPNGDGTINACPIAGCPASGPLVLVSGLRSGGMIVQDEEALYWAEWGTSGGDGRVRKVAKP